MLRFSVLLISVVSLGSVTPSVAQSLEAQEYYFNRVENAWKPLATHEVPKPNDDLEFVKFLTLQEYIFNSVENVWEPLAAPPSTVRAMHDLRAVGER